ncbi:MAG: radical SAM protein [Candidatus Lokiarchaeota archaeon]|nr:radical SAM protein [Candidatus Lokiarchaeota archaeon]
MSCLVCGSRDKIISKHLGVCRDCIINNYPSVIPYIEKIREQARKKFDLPIKIPHTTNGKKCGMCGNDCRLNDGELGYCGLVFNENGHIKRHTNANLGFLHWYFDPNPTNCVGSWSCPAGTGCGYPEFAYKNGPEYGYYNLAVFLAACNSDCLYCQNYSYKEMVRLKLKENFITPQQLVDNIHPKISCVCYFGGCPSVQMPFTIKVNKLVSELARKENRPIRICYESNGNFTWPLLKKAAGQVLDSGGCIKFDLKCFNENLNLALCGISNKLVIDNFKKVSRYIDERKNFPFLIASTLLVPGYITPDEIEQIASFMVQIDETIPYSLLGFSPCFELSDLPTTSRKDAFACKDAAEKAGLKNVRIGNIHLLR